MGNLPLGGSSDVVTLEREDTTEDLEGWARDVILEVLAWVGACGIDLSLGLGWGGRDCLSALCSYGKGHGRTTSYGEGSDEKGFVSEHFE